MVNVPQPAQSYIINNLCDLKTGKIGVVDVDHSKSIGTLKQYGGKTSPWNDNFEIDRVALFHDEWAYTNGHSPSPRDLPSTGGFTTGGANAPTGQQPAKVSLHFPIETMHLLEAQCMAIVSKFSNVR